MCGIAGIAHSEPSRPADAAVVHKMCAVLRHRGPDDTGIMVHGPIGMGMTRLSIIDLVSGRQPIHNEDKTVWIVFNGEIYNYEKLRRNLLQWGHHFRTSSDTEAIVHLYEEYGDDCVNHLRGMFAFAIWDEKQEKLLIARDRIGIKPLYYYLDGARIIFASEIKGILQCEDIPRRVNPPAIVNYLAYGYVPDPETMFQGIHKLPPGHLLVYRRGACHIRQYWDMEFTVGKVQPERFYIDRLLEVLSEAVKIHLMSDVPLGAFLSGGIDSSAVVALMARHMGGRVKTFSIGFEDKAYDELKYARLVARRFGTDHHEEIVRPSADGIILDLVRQFDEPFADSSAIPTYYVCRLGRRSVTVALSGDGGDELFGGYTRYLDGPVTKAARWMPGWLRKGLLDKLTWILPEWHPGINTLRHMACESSQRYIRHMSRGLSTIHQSVFTKEFNGLLSSSDPSPILLRYLDRVREKDELTKRLYVDTKTYLPGDILTKVDRTSMLVSLEVRVPILDHHLVEFAATIPPELKVRGTTTKYIFKKAAERLLPKEIVYRAKRGFAVPLSGWLRREWRDTCHELVLGRRTRERQVFDNQFLRRVFLEHQWRRRDQSHILWSLMVLELWFREMVDR